MVEASVSLVYFNTTPLRQSKQQASQTFTPSPLLASHLQGWGSRLKHRTGTMFAHRLTSERTCSTITIGVPALIQFVLPIHCLHQAHLNRAAHIALHCYLSTALKNQRKNECTFFLSVISKISAKIWVIKNHQLVNSRSAAYVAVYVAVTLHTQPKPIVS